jgi:hypothetical protein
MKPSRPTAHVPVWWLAAIVVAACNSRVEQVEPPAPEQSKPEPSACQKNFKTEAECCAATNEAGPFSDQCAWVEILTEGGASEGRCVDNVTENCQETACFDEQTCTDFFYYQRYGSCRQELISSTLAVCVDGQPDAAPPPSPCRDLVSAEQCCSSAAPEHARCSWVHQSDEERCIDRDSENCIKTGCPSGSACYVGLMSVSEACAGMAYGTVGQCGPELM